MNIKYTDFKISNYVDTNYFMHVHPYYELYYFISGDIRYIVEGTEYRPTPHSLILLAPYTLHGGRIFSNADYIRSTIHFLANDILPERRSLLLSCFSNTHKNNNVIFYENTKDFDLDSYFCNLVRLDKMSPEIKKQYYPIYLESLLAQINLMCQRLNPSPSYNTASSTIDDLLSYINEHLSETITLDRLSNHFYVSKYYMNRAFKKAIGTTIIDYIIYKRVLIAQQFLLNGETAADAALKSGFSDYSVFYRAYKRVFGYGPKKDKQKSSL